MASDNMMAVKPVILPPSIKQRAGVADADAVFSSFNEAGFPRACLLCGSCDPHPDR